MDMFTHPAMRRAWRRSGAATFAAAVIFLCMARGSELFAAAQDATEADEESSAAYAASVPFDLHPAVGRASRT